MDRDNELDVVRRLRLGDPAAFDQAYDEYRSVLFSFLARLSRSRSDAEDLAEETWLRLVTNARRLRPDTRLRPWLFAVARNLYYSACRSRLLDEECAGRLIDVWPILPSRPSPFEQTAANEMERRLERALAALPASDREVLLLITVSGFSPAEAAAICEVSAVAIRQRLSRARARLRHQLDLIDASASRKRKEVPA